jgi:hypothetical protein
MTTWATFNNIAETSNIEQGEVFYVDRLGNFQWNLLDERTRFSVTKNSDDGSWGFRDLEGKAREGQAVACDGSMRKGVEWMAARVLYGA